MDDTSSPIARSLEQPDAWRFRPDIEGLRAIAILGVILFHAGISRVSGGFLGVDVFFVLSGFLITGILIEEVRKTGTVSLSAFWARRARRLLPAATLVSLATLGLMVLLESPLAGERYAKSAISFATYWSNLLYWRRDADYFDQSVASDPFLHTWSLAIEEQYYLLFAPCVLLLALAARGRGFEPFRRRLAIAAVSVTLASLAGAFYLTATQPLLSFYGLPSRAWEFGIGAVLALTASQARSGAGGRRMDGWVGLLGLGAVVAGFLIAKEGTPHPGLVTLLPVLGTASLIHLGSRAATPVGRLLELPVMRWLGRLSYSWYLWHWPLTVYWDKLSPGGAVPLVLGMPLGSLALAQFTYLLVEAPARTVPWLQPARRGLLAALALAVATVGTALLARDRVRARLRSPQYAHILAARDSLGSIYRDGCHLSMGAPGTGACWYGARDSETTVVVFGDSHAAAWFPAFESMLPRRAWRLVPLTKSGCPSVGVLRRVRHGGGLTQECERWREAAFVRIRELRPAIVVVSNFHWQNVVDETTGKLHLAPSRPDLWERGLQRTLRALPPETAILLLEDSPLPNFDVPTCLIENVHATANCAFPRARSIARELAGVERRAALADPRTAYLDLADRVCDGSVCPAVRDRTVMYMDRHHLSVAAAASLGPYLLPVLDSMLAARGRE